MLMFACIHIINKMCLKKNKRKENIRKYCVLHIFVLYKMICFLSFLLCFKNLLTNQQIKTLRIDDLNILQINEQRFYVKMRRETGSDGKKEKFVNNLVYFVVFFLQCFLLQFDRLDIVFRIFHIHFSINKHNETKKNQTKIDCTNNKSEQKIQRENIEAKNFFIHIMKKKITFCV